MRSCRRYPTPSSSGAASRVRHSPGMSVQFVTEGADADYAPHESCFSGQRRTPIWRMRMRASPSASTFRLIMSRRLTALTLATLVAASASAQEAKRIGPTGSIAGRSSQELNQKQVEIVRKVNAYFNQLANLKGSFVQTGADKKSQRGKFYISRPGRFRFEFNLPSRVVII